MNKIVLSSPAKLNLFLSVKNKRPDGFHNIETLFQRISLADEIVLRELNQQKIKITCNDPDVPVDHKNLVYKVAELLRNDFRVSKGVHIDIKKQIPVAAGLAGGSSNAATVLMGLNRLWKLDLSRTQLIEYAKKIGSDVAFFLYDASWALGTERGDKIKVLHINNTKLWYVIIVPRLKLLTKRIYGSFNLSLTKKNANVNILFQNLKNSNLKSLNSLLINDLEKVILRVAPQLKAIKEKLKTFKVKGTLVSGSGPSVYAIIDTQQEAEKIANYFSKRFKRVFVVHTL